jgi:predicted TPR repeat methyltransferase
MLNGISLGIVMIVVLLIGGFLLTLLINAFLVPLFKTPKSVLREILLIMDLKKEDHLVDLGSGDGRLLLKAYKESGCKCTGYDISPIMLILARTKMLVQFPFTKDVIFEAEDIYKVDLKKFTKVYCYLDEKSMDILKPKFEEYIKQGGKIYSYRYEIKDLDGEKIMLRDGNTLYIY